MKKTIFWFLLLCSALLFGCGGDSGSSGDTGGGPPYSSAVNYAPMDMTRKAAGA